MPDIVKEAIERLNQTTRELRETRPSPSADQGHHFSFPRPEKTSSDRATTPTPERINRDR